jgi:hypothetical protein
MKMGTKGRKRLLAMGAGLILIAAVATGLFIQQNKATERKRQLLAVGAEWQQMGWLTQADYMRVTAIKDGVVRTRTIRDADLDWLLAELQKTENSVARAKILGVLSTLKNTPSAQSSRIATSITPLLASKDNLERRYALRVKKKLDLP